MISARLKLLFLLLVLTQMAHSTEEYVGRLWEVFAPAQFLSTLIYPPDPHIGFLIANISLALIGLGGYFFVVQRERPSAMVWIWAWIVLEGSNGVLHVAWAAADGGYRPGVGTAVIFLILVPLLVREVLSTRVQPG